MKSTIEDSTTEKVSQPLQDIVEKLIAQNKSLDSLQRDLFFVVIIVLIFENDFLLLENDIEIKDPVSFIDLEKLHSYKSPMGVFETSFVLNGVKSIPLKLIMSPLGAMVLVNVIIEKFNRETYSVCLPLSRYVVSPQASTIPMIFRDLKHLSVTFKNKILSAVKSRIMSYCGYPSASLIGLPDDVIFNIILKLSIKDIINLRRTCCSLNNVMENEILWHKLYKRDFSTSTENVTCSDWMEKYKEEYLQQLDKILRSQQHHRAAGTLHDYMDHSDFMSYIENPLWNII